MLKSVSHASGPDVMAYEAAGGKLNGVSGLWSAHATCLRLNAVLARWHAPLISSSVFPHLLHMRSPRVLGTIHHFLRHDMARHLTGDKTPWGHNWLE